MQIHAGVFSWPMSVGWEDCGWMDALDADLHFDMVAAGERSVLTCTTAKIRRRTRRQHAAKGQTEN
jgi:hypothetical protein